MCLKTVDKRSESEILFGLLDGMQVLGLKVTCRVFDGQKQCASTGREEDCKLLNMNEQDLICLKNQLHKCFL